MILKHEQAPTESLAYFTFSFHDEITRRPKLLLNHEQAPNKFVNDLVLEQLRDSGMVDAVSTDCPSD